MNKKIIFYFLILFITNYFNISICVNAVDDDDSEIILDSQVNNSTTTDYNDANIKNQKIVPKPDNIPDFPQEDNIEYKKLFDNSFTNVVEMEYVLPDDNDIFIAPYTMREINKQIEKGNHDIITQIDAIKAEKKTQENNNDLDKNKISQSRYRVVAFLTLDQMLLSDLFETNPDGYYIDFVKSKLVEKGKTASLR